MDFSPDPGPLVWRAHPSPGAWSCRWLLTGRLVLGVGPRSLGLSPIGVLLGPGDFRTVGVGLRRDARGLIRGLRTGLGRLGGISTVGSIGGRFRGVGRSLGIRPRRVGRGRGLLAPLLATALLIGPGLGLVQVQRLGELADLIGGGCRLGIGLTIASLVRGVILGHGLGIPTIGRGVAVTRSLVGLTGIGPVGFRRALLIGALRLRFVGRRGRIGRLFGGLGFLLVLTRLLVGGLLLTGGQRGAHLDDLPGGLEPVRLRLLRVADRQPVFDLRAGLDLQRLQVQDLARLEVAGRRPLLEQVDRAEDLRPQVDVEGGVLDAVIVGRRPPPGGP